MTTCFPLHVHLCPYQESPDNNNNRGSQCKVGVSDSLITMGNGIARGRVRTYDDDDYDDDGGVAQYGAHTPNNRLIGTYSLGYRVLL